MIKHSRIFVADLSEDFCTFLSDSLEQYRNLEIIGFADNGETALEMCRRLCPDILITEILLPGLDGLGLIRQLGEDGINPKTIVLSGFFSDTVAAGISQLGVDFCFRKPCSLREIVHWLCVLSDDGQPDPGRAAGNYDREISSALLACGIFPHLHGYHLLREGIKIAIQNPESLQGLTKILYPDLAKAFDTTAKCVERSIRNAIQNAWNADNAESRRSYFGEYAHQFESKPSNGRFISAVAEFLRVSAEAESRRNALQSRETVFK